MKTHKFYGVCGNCYKLDESIWEAIEDKSDGYRSYLESIEIKENTDGLIFFSDPIATVFVKNYDDGSKKGWTLEDSENGHTWLFVGTTYYDNYYPCFRFEYIPMNPNEYKSEGNKKSRWELFVENTEE